MLRRCMAALGANVRSIDWSGIAQLSPADGLQIADAGHGLVVDVREPAELQEVSLKSSNVINVPMSKLSLVPDAADKSQALLDLGFPADLGTSEERPAFVICKAGVRGQRMCELLKGLGRTHVANLEGGIMNCSETR
eukprot:TRINITY_DN55503_c0_g1_i1.p1 TRINITY_DN55503_c0_g1~~TRINITY_DN55503_c0_g1_i1.p1  ORF type:complete len:137 (+),score=39.88 TRINITY_DN55503_c0_g1_i1:225-635(+)